jgi:NADH:ubiquinone oxidoreductase subunit 2 (subunit N)
VTAFLCTAPKVAGFGALLNIFIVAFMEIQVEWQNLFWILAALTMTVGNISALMQSHVKRMLAFSSVSHAGYLVLGVLVLKRDIQLTVLFYLVVYSVMIYGATGTTNYNEIASAATSGSILSKVYFSLGIGLLLIGFAFKVALVPFHMWSPDVYQGAPTTVTAFLCTAPKVAGFGALLNIFIVAFMEIQVEWQNLFWILAALTMTVGNISALMQSHVKRMLAFSSVSHAGYLVLGVLVLKRDIQLTVLFYLVVYSVMIYGATGTTNYNEIASAATSGSILSKVYFSLGIGLLLIGFAFKVALVPFHMWSPDVYQGAPTTVTAFLCTAPKVAGFGALLNIFIVAFMEIQVEWQNLFWILAALTMTVGNISALMQSHVKRMLAFSSVSHAGYLVLGVLVLKRDIQLTVLFYLVVYSVMIYGATGTTNYNEIASAATSGSILSKVYFSLGIGLLLIGFAFKVALVPFHMWSPDVYQ